MRRESRTDVLMRRCHAEPFLDFLALERGLRPRTLAAYRSDLKQFLVYVSDGSEPPALTRIDHRVLDRYVAHLRRRGTAASSIRRAQSALRAYFGFLVAEQLLAENPADRMDAPVKAKKLPEFLTQAEAARLVEAVDPDSPAHWRDRAVLELLYATGMRVSELTGLSVPDLDLEDGTAVVFGKGGKERLVPVGGPARRAAERYLTGLRPELDRGASGGALFLNNRGARLSRMSVWTIVSRAAKRAGIERKVSPHTLRHTCATHLLEGGADLVAVQEMLGHADVSTTQVYTHLDRKHLRRVHRTHHPRS